MSINPKSEYEFKTYHSLKIIRQFDWLLNCYVLDFFVNDHWNKLPKSWREVFENMDPSELGEILLGGKSNVLLPLSFMALLKSLKYLSISRDTSKGLNNVGIEKTQENHEFIPVPSTHPRLLKLFTKHVKTKKRHEIDLISELVSKVAAEEKCDTVVDIGSGLGHLVRTLAYKYQLKSIGIEGQHKLTVGARDLDTEFENIAFKHTTSDSVLKSCKPEHINMMLSPEMQNNTTLSDVLKQHSNNGYGLVGLHPCGDLGPLLLEMFAKTPEIKYICIVGCCYMKLSCQEDKFKGYPLSAFVSNLENNHLSYESREIACHALETYCQRLVKGLYEDLQVHTFRALLEKIIVTKWPNMKHLGLRSIKHHNTLTFQRYCEIATERAGISLSAEDTCSESIDNSLKMWKKIVIFYSLRLILAPLVESVILMDRVMSLREKGIFCEAHPLFDPIISPRNHILIARKSTLTRNNL